MLSKVGVDLLSVFALTFAVSGSAMASMGSGSHGGDPVQLRFGEARYHAATTLKGFISKTGSDAEANDVAAWIDQFKDVLITEVLESPFSWTEDAKATCASTDLTSKSTIYLSLATCREGALNVKSAGQLLIHEAAHHLGVSDEDRATSIALAVYAANTAVASPTLSTKCELGYSLDGVNMVQKQFSGQILPGESYAFIDEKIEISGDTFDFYVYYDGQYAAINFGSTAAGTYHNADSEVAIGKFFGLVSRDPSAMLKMILISCTSAE